MKLLRDNGLSIMLLLASVLTIGGMFATGWIVHNEELAQHHNTPLSLLSYATSGHFLSALFENWESEFLQMSAYVVLTAFLFQKGSAESKDPDEQAPQDEDPKQRKHERNVPWAVKTGVASFLLHLRYSADAAAVTARMHGDPVATVFEQLESAEFWFESLQNWQSEFLSTAILVILSIFLRFRRSPQSKPVAAPHNETGG